MPTTPRNYTPLPYAGPPRAVPNYGTLGELMGLRARNSAQGWAQLAQVFNNFVEQRNAQQAAAQQRSDRLAQQQAAEQLKRDEMAALASEREATQQLRKDAQERQSRLDARQKAEDVLPGVLSSPMADELRPSGRVQVIEGVPMLMRTPAQVRQAGLDAQAKAVAEKANADRLADNARQQQQFEEVSRHNKVMEQRQPRPLARDVVQGPNGPLLVDKETGRTEPILGPDGVPLKTAQSAQERMDSRKFQKAAPVFDAVSELSEKINTQQGVIAKMSGEVEKQKAKLNLNDDVAEYQALISAFTPLVARSFGHTGVLTQQDVDSVKEIFPKPGDSKSLRDRKVARLKRIVSDLENTEGVSNVAPTGAPKKNPNR